MKLTILNPCSKCQQLPGKDRTIAGGVPFYFRTCPGCGAYTSGLSTATVDRRWNADHPPASFQPTQKRT